MWPFRKKKTDRDILIDSIKSEAIDLDGLFNSINHRDQLGLLVKELSSACHPDRFPQSLEKQELATKLFKQVQENKNNYSRLLQIKEEIEKQLAE